MGSNLIGSLTAVYTLADYNNGLTPRVGQRYCDPASNKKYIFLKNTGATSIPAKGTAEIADASAYEVTIGTTAATQQFAGARVSSATTVAQNEFAWFIYQGNTTLHTGGTIVTVAAGDLVIQDADDGDIDGHTLPAMTFAAGAIDTGTDMTAAEAAEIVADLAALRLSVASLLGAIGVAQAAQASTDSDVEVNINNSVWG